MFLVKVVRLSLIAIVFITVYLPITINPRIFERNQGDSVSYLTADNTTAKYSYRY